MTEQEFQDMMLDVLTELCDFAEEDFGFDVPELTNADVYSFNDCGLMTRDNGVVIRLQTGEEFQLTIKRR